MLLALKTSSFVSLNPFAVVHIPVRYTSEPHSRFSWTHAAEDQCMNHNKHALSPLAYSLRNHFTCRQLLDFCMVCDVGKIHILAEDGGEKNR